MYTAAPVSATLIPPSRIKTKLKDTEVRAESWIELTEKAFEFVLYAHKAFLFGNAEVKKEILNAIGLNQTLIDNIFRFDAINWVEPIKETYPALEAKIKAFEPEKYGTDEWRKTAFAAFRPQVRALVDDIGTRIRAHEGYPYIPDLTKRLERV